jgi:hypothetical protein
MITYDAKFIRENQSSIVIAKAAFNNKETLFTSKLELNLEKGLVKCYIWSTAVCGSENRTVWKVDHKYLESFEVWYWRRIETIRWTDRVRNKEVLHRVKEKRNVLHTIRRRKANWIGRIFRRNCILKHITARKVDGGIQMTGRQKIRRNQLLGDIKETR